MCFYSEYMVACFDFIKNCINRYFVAKFVIKYAFQRCFNLTMVDFYFIFLTLWVWPFCKIGGQGLKHHGLIISKKTKLKIRLKSGFWSAYEFQKDCIKEYHIKISVTIRKNDEKIDFSLFYQCYSTDET